MAEDPTRGGSSSQLITNCEELAANGKVEGNVGDSDNKTILFKILSGGKNKVTRLQKSRP